MKWHRENNETSFVKQNLQKKIAIDVIDVMLSIRFFL